jgi:hypothetical protein
MNAAIVKPLQIGDRFRLRESNSVNGNGMVTLSLPGGYVRVRRIDLGFPTTHRLHALEIAPSPDELTQRLETLSDLGSDLDGA